MNAKHPLLLAITSAFLMWLAWPPIPYTTPLLLVGLVPLLIVVNSIQNDTRPKKGKRVFLFAGLTFVIWNTASIYWVYNAISAINDPFTSILVSLIPYGLGALLMTFSFWMYHRLSRIANRTIAYVGLVTFYISMEYLHQTWDLSFPWMTLGNGLSDMHQLAQWYEYTGVYGGSAWILISNILAFEAYKKVIQPGPALKPIAIWLIWIIIPVAISLTSYYKYTEQVAPVNVVVVQPDIDPYEKFTSMSSMDQLHILTRLSDSLAQPNTEYFIWPETAIPQPTVEDRIRSSAEFITAQSFLSKYKNGTIITGIESVKLYNDKETVSAKVNSNGGFLDNYNAALQIENSANVQFYHKSKLVPGVEKMPFPNALSVLGPIFEGFGGTMGGWGWQDKPGVFYAYSGIGVVPVICYESLWGSWIGEAVKNNAQFIAVITNDAWWGNTSGKDQHLRYAKLRAIETRRYVVRSANTGISAIINQKGDITQQTKWWTRTALKADINMNDELTFYVRNGDLIAIFSYLLGGLLALFVCFSKLKSTFKKDTSLQ
ncbi:apolipoprotein N-acyltransferase [Pedobacter sp. PWIIR3]